MRENTNDLDSVRSGERRKSAFEDMTRLNCCCVVMGKSVISLNFMGIFEIFPINNIFISFFRYFEIMISQYFLQNRYSLSITLNFSIIIYHSKILKQISINSRKSLIDQYSLQSLKSLNSIIL